MPRDLAHLELLESPPHIEPQNLQLKHKAFGSSHVEYDHSKLLTYSELSCQTLANNGLQALHLPIQKQSYCTLWPFRNNWDPLLGPQMIMGSQVDTSRPLYSLRILLQRQ